MFGLPVPVQQSSVSSIKNNSEKASALRDSAVIIIDEASMVPATAVDCIDRLLRDIMKSKDHNLSKVPMGGKVILFGGDFRQVLPVVPMSSKVQIIEECFQRSKIWRHVCILHLKQNMRANLNETTFCDWLLRLGSGTLESNRTAPTIHIPNDFVLSECTMVQHVYGDTLTTENIHNYTDKIIVSPLNEHCEHLNDEVLKKFKETQKNITVLINNFRGACRKVEYTDRVYKFDNAIWNASSQINFKRRSDSYANKKHEPWIWIS